MQICLKSHLRWLICTLLVVGLGGCKEQVSDEQIEKISEELQRTFKDATTALRDMTPSKDKVSGLAGDEIEKLHALEYRVEEIPWSSEIDELNQRLAELGRDRWDCFHLERAFDVNRIYCKRRPKSYLRYIPRVFP